jgi:5-methylcytosine-specific restriction endonuclease McrA
MLNEGWGCAEEFVLRTQHQFARAVVFCRDKGICAECGVDTIATPMPADLVGMEPRKSWWEVDHTIEIADGGGGGVDNLVTLCTPCHRTKSEATHVMRRAASRRA